MDEKAMKSLPTMFNKENGTITAANSSKLADGAAALILMAGLPLIVRRVVVIYNRHYSLIEGVFVLFCSEEVAVSQNIAPLARVIGFSDAALGTIL